MMKSQEKLDHISLFESKPGKVSPADYQVLIQMSGGGVIGTFNRGDSVDAIVYQLERMIHMIKESTHERIGPMEYADYPNHLVRVAEWRGLEFEPINKRWISKIGGSIARSADELERYLIRCGYLTIRE